MSESLFLINLISITFFRPHSAPTALWNRHQQSILARCYCFLEWKWRNKTCRCTSKWSSFGKRIISPSKSKGCFESTSHKQTRHKIIFCKRECSFKNTCYWRWQEIIYSTQGRYFSIQWIDASESWKKIILLAIN